MPSTLPATRDEVEALLRREHMPDEIVQAVMAQARPVLQLDLHPQPDTLIPLGASKFGGAADLPSGFAWPQRGAYANGDAWAVQEREQAARLIAEAANPSPTWWTTPTHAREFAAEHIALAELVVRPAPLTFLAQLNLEELAVEPGFDPILPNHGRLLVFYDCVANPPSFAPSSAVGMRLIWDPTPVDQLVRHPAPDVLQAPSGTKWQDGVFEPERIEAQSATSLFPPDGFVETVFESDDPALVALYEDVATRFEALDGDGIPHQLGGWPHLLQTSIQYECQLAANGVDCGSHVDRKDPKVSALLEHMREWRLVLQLGPDLAGPPSPSPRFPSVGAFYIMMRDADIRARAFDRAWMVYQCD